MVSPSDIPVPGWNAHRHPQDPLRQPSYSFQDVPKCAKNLEGSMLEEVTDRDHFKEVMSEMLLLCNEAVRRANSVQCSSKPLSLEYIADRIDVDDPCFGYLVRSKEGMLQGFITVTTFTNWQKSFRWDSLHELAFYYDDALDEEPKSDRGQKKGDKAGCKRPRPQRKVDRDGTLAHALQSTIRLGDPYNEGIVWPRIAEISLLGALGCGKALVSLVLEKLEFLKSSKMTNYDYVVLQATDNSIPFYESIGFTRVGAVTDDRSLETPAAGAEQGRQMEQDSSNRSPSPTSSDSSAPVAVPLEPTSPLKPDTLAISPQIVSTPVIVYKTKKPGETLVQIAKHHHVKAWDIMFLNKEIYADLSPGSRLMKGTSLFVPRPPEPKPPLETASPTQWFVAKENDTPRKIAKKFGVACNDVVRANMKRLPGLQPSSRLKAGTRVKVSHLDEQDDLGVPYCHWTFPDDAVIEGGEPSYMMAIKLKRKTTARYIQVVQESLAVKICPYSPPPLLLPRENQAITQQHDNRKTKKTSPPEPPKDPPTGFDIFKDHQIDLHKHLNEDTPRIVEMLEEKWLRLSESKRDRYKNVALEEQKRYDKAFEEYEVEYSLWKDENDSSISIPVEHHKDTSLFSKVVKLKEHALTKSEFTYWFVLTYIPDLKWCHLAPMVQDGFFGPERKKSLGRPKWKLVEEQMGKELDISSSFCIPVKSKAMKKTVDADKEEWDIIDGPKQQELKSCKVPMGTGRPVTSRPIKKEPLRARSAIKPLSGKIAMVSNPKSSVIVKPTGSNKSMTSTATTELNSDSVINTVDAPRSPLRSPTLPLISSTDTATSKKRKLSEDLLTESNPARKARTVHSAGARRTVLQD